MRKLLAGCGRRSRPRRLGVVALLAFGLLGVAGCVADPPPLIGTAIGGDGQATVSWQAPLAAPFPISAYEVTPWIGQVAQPPIRFNSTATTQTVTGLVNGTTYTFTVKAINALGNDSASSDASNPVTPGAGDLVVVRVGDGMAALSSASTAVFLDEYTTSGASVQSIPMPTVASGSNAPLTNSGTATSEGALTLSSNRHYLALAGYGASPGVASVATTTSSTVNRVIAVVNSNGNVDTSTLLNAYSGSNIRGAASTDGFNLWTGGNGTSPDGGVRYTARGAIGAGTSVEVSAANVRVPEVVNGQLYVSSGSSPFTGVNAVGTGTPTTAGNTMTTIASVTGGVLGYVFLDRDPSIAGPDTLYAADQSQGIKKFSFNGTSWTTQGGISGNFTGITGTVSGSTAVLYATSGSTAGNQLVTLTDTAASASFLTPTGPTVLASAAANTVLRGVAFAPIP